ncbi:MAG: V-type ATP synthase subunit E family protein [Erysipelotrichaceae bacterium]|nr:V-type ATP synthase subunit E family protein [Erysipelotrichaceae bacterium]MDY6034410.1 V-type ATP synthase subunit E family protein [Bulleidia sp.]
MEDFEEKIIKSIKSDMLSQSTLVEETVMKEIQMMHDEQLNYFKVGLRKETEAYLEKETNDLRLSASSQLSQETLKIKQDLLKLRMDFIKQLLDGASKKIEDFVKSDEYRSYLEENIDKVSITKNGVFTVRKQDEELFKDILKEKNIEANVQTGYFRFGGFTYTDLDSRLEYRCDLVERLEEARKFFRQHSGFIITEGSEDHE